MESSSFVIYIERLQLMVFFAGYPLIYVLVNALSTNRIKDTFVNRLHKLLPLAYTLSGVFFLGYILKTLYPNYSGESIISQFSYLKLWGLLSLLFWIKPLREKPLISLFHSLVFFSFLLRDLFIHITSTISDDLIKNDMKVYTTSLLLNAGCLVLIAVIYLILRRYRRPISFIN